MNIILSSGGNDSVALIKWAKNNDLKDVIVIFNDTGWAIPWWKDRIAEVSELSRSYGFQCVTTKSIGFKNMIRKKKGFPMCAGPMQWCSSFLKHGPTNEWLKINDPLKKAALYVGIRRDESQNRANHPRTIIADMKYGGRRMEFPLVEYTEKTRDFLIDETPVDILLHSSMECFPCVCSNRSDFRLLHKYPERIAELAKLETEMGYTRKGKPRVMFRPYRHMQATGIWQVIDWALCERGKYKKG